MKKLFLVCLLLLSGRAFATDTSGCSPLQERENHLITTRGAELEVHSFKALRSSCWNAGDAYLVVNYRWLQINTNYIPAVHFWIQINSQSQSADAYVTCQPITWLALSPDTSSDTNLTCSGTVKIPLKDSSPVRVEVAPQLGDQWDTLGYQQNYIFQL